MRWTSVLLMVSALLGCAASTRPQPCKFVIDWNVASPERERAIWLAYLMKRVMLRQPGNECQGSDVVLTPSFDEEFQAREATLKTYRDLQKHDAQLDLAYFNDLSRVEDAGFLREYVWIYLHQPSWSQEPEGLKLGEFGRWRESNLAGHKVETQGSIKSVASGP